MDYVNESAPVVAVSDLAGIFLRDVDSFHDSNSFRVLEF